MIRMLENLYARAHNRCASRPAAPAEAAKQDGFLIGVDATNDSRNIYVPRAEFTRSGYFLGASGSGKTNTLMQIASFFEGTDTVVMIDLRGDLLDRMLLQLAGRHRMEDVAERLYVIDLRFPGLCAPWNMFARAEGRDFRTVALNATDCLQQTAMSWGVTIQQTARNVCLTLAEAGLGLPLAQTLLKDDAKRKEVLASVTDETALLFWREYEGLNARQRREIAEPFLNKISNLVVRPELAEWMNSRRGMDLAKVLDGPEPAVVLVGLGAEKYSPQTSALIGSFILASIVQVVLSRASVKEADRRYVRLLVDEFQNFGNSDSLSTILFEGRRYRCTLYAAHQNVCQLSKETYQAFSTNAGIQLYFGVDTAQAKGIAGNLVGGDFKAEEIKELLVTQPTGSCFCVRRGQPPVHVKVPRYDDPDVAEADVLRLRELAHQKFSAGEDRERRTDPVPPATAVQGGEVSYDQLPDIE